MSRATRHRDVTVPDPDRDQGGTLIIALVTMIIGSLIIIPMMTYTMTVTRSNRGLQDRAERAEALKGGLRIALQNPTLLYAACVNSGRTTKVDLVDQPALGTHTWCTTTKDSQQYEPKDLRWALATVQAGSGAVLPGDYTSPSGDQPELDGTIGTAWCTSLLLVAPQSPIPCGKKYAASGAVDTLAWLNDATTVSTASKIFLPQLPPISNALGYAGGYQLPAGDIVAPTDGGPSACTVFFPGRYMDDVNLTGNSRYYFVSGVYYFEKTFRISGNANVVVGSGSTPGCVDSDAVAVADAINAPVDAYSDGVGGTFVFGANGRFLVDTTTATGSYGASFHMNRRLVPETDPLAVIDNVAIMSVNGRWDGTSLVDLDLPAQLHVPHSMVAPSTLNGSPTDPTGHGYNASTLVSTATAPASCAPPTAVSASCPIIDINLTTNAKFTIDVAGYVSVPQGSVSIQTLDATSATNKNISFGGGVVAAQMVINPVTPQVFQIGLVNPVVQKTFMITTTDSKSPPLTATALVQVNATGGYAVNSWVIAGP